MNICYFDSSQQCVVAGLFGQSEQIFLRLLKCTLISTRPGSRVEIYTPARALFRKDTLKPIYGCVKNRYLVFEIIEICFFQMKGFTPRGSKSTSPKPFQKPTSFLLSINLSLPSLLKKSNAVPSS